MIIYADFPKVKKHRKKAGMMILVLALGVLLVFSVLGLSLYSNIGGLANQTSAFSALSMMDHAAFEAANVVFAELQKSLNNPEDKNHQLLKSSENQDLIKTWSENFAFPEANDLYLNLNSLSVTFEKTADLGSDWHWKDSAEKLFRLTLTVDISGGRSKFKRFRRQYRFVKLGKIQRLALPVISKFTLYVRNPELTDEQNQGYNCVANFIDGELGVSSKAQPICLINSQEKHLETVADAGWVFLGGDKELQLHVTSGNDVKNGELFQFYSLTQPEKSPPVFEFSELPSTKPFNDGVYFLNSAVKAQLSIRGSYFGFYQWDKKTGSDMNLQGALQKYFASANSRTMNSSCLHLLGNYTHPSPTLVYGKVNRAFAYYSGIIYKASGEGSEDKFLDILEAPVDVVNNGSKESFWNTVNLKRSFETKKFSLSPLELSAQEITAKRLFASQKNYLKYSSNIVVESINRTFDYFFNETGMLPPPEKLKDKTGFGYDLTGEKIEIKNKSSGGLYFSGDCRNLDVKKILTDRFSLILPDEKTFLSRFVSDSVLDLQNQVVLVKGPLQLPARLKVKSAGIIAAKGQITLLGGIEKSDSGPLTIVSMENDIVLKVINEDIWAHLVALEGTVYPQNNNPVKLRGALTVDKLYAAGNASEKRFWAGGGEIAYDNRLDPAFSEKTCYGVSLSDYYDDFQILKEDEIL